MSSSSLPKQQIADWWAQNPQTYSDSGVHGGAVFHGKAVEFGSHEFFANADESFLAWNKALHASRPFDRIYPYDRYVGRQVLEIGCGMGCMAMNWAKAGAQITAVDLNAVAVEQTRRRFDLYGLQGRIQQADGNGLEFEDNTFDYVYSWGVLHHSPDLGRSLQEMMRVLKPGGEFALMLYYRPSIMYWVSIRLFEGWLHGESMFTRDELELSSRYTDGREGDGNPHTWPVTKREVRSMLGSHTESLAFRVLGTDLDYELQRACLIPGFERTVPLFLRKVLARRWGWSLFTTGRKKN